MLTEINFLNRELKYFDYSDISKKSLSNENTITKLKKRKSILFLLVSNNRRIRMNLDTSTINLNLNNTTNFLKIFDMIKDPNEKCKLIHNLFTNQLLQAKLILSRYQEALNLKIDYNFLSSSEFILDIIEKCDDVIKLIAQNKENIHFLIQKMNSIIEEIINYDSNYIMITSNLLIFTKVLDKELKKQIDHNKLLNLIIKNKTEISYDYMFYIFAYLYHVDGKQIENFENIFESIILAMKNKFNNNEDLNILLEVVYDILILFSKAPKFSRKFYENYELFFKNGNFDEKDEFAEAKLSIISNLFKHMNSQEIKLFLEKDGGNLLNIIKYTLIFFANINNGNLASGKNKFGFFLLNTKILLTITFHEELTYLLLENKEYFNLIISTFSSVFHSNEINNSIEDYETLLEVFNTILKIIINIIKNDHKLFVSQLIRNNFHLIIKDKFTQYIKINNINENHFKSFINIIGSLYDYQKKDKLKTEIVKLDLDNNKFSDIINDILKTFSHNDNITKECINFLDSYYSSVTQKKFFTLSEYDI